MAATCRRDMDEGTTVKTQEKNYEAFYKSLVRDVHRTFETPDINFYGKFSRIPLREGSRRARISSLIPEARRTICDLYFVPSHFRSPAVSETIAA